jgi:hypothetical protein
LLAGFGVALVIDELLNEGQPKFFARGASLSALLSHSWASGTRAQQAKTRASRAIASTSSVFVASHAV